MRWRRFARFATFALVLCFVGCLTGGSGKTLPSREPLPQVTLPERVDSRLVRSQRPEPGSPAPMVDPEVVPGDRMNVRVRAWVNGKAIYDDEVLMAMIRTHGGNMPRVPPSQVAAAQAKIFNDELNALIDRELILQDAFTKLQKNPKVLEKVQQAAAKAFDKKMGQIAARLKASSIDQMNAKIGRDQLATMRKQDERDYIAGEYVRSRVFPLLQRVNHRDIREYYDTHLTEFRTVDKVTWQNVFLAVNSARPTLAHARQAAEEILKRVRAGEDFSKFLSLDDGNSWTARKGGGDGGRRGEIQPRELEEALFRMRDGDLGPPVEIGTGVHLFRLVKREHAGQQPFDDKVQTDIERKLKGEIFEREYKRIVKELRERSVVELVKPGS